MCTSALADAVTALDAQDVAKLPDAVLRDELVELLVALNQVHAQVVRRVAVFDSRGLSINDGCRTAKSWLRAFGRMSDAAAGAWVKAGRLLRQLPRLAEAATAGRVSGEHIARVVKLADRVGSEPVRDVEHILTQAATELGPSDLQKVCDRVRAHADPDGLPPDPHVDYERRGLTLSRFDGMLLVRGQLDPEGAAALTAALDAFTIAPAGSDERTPAQRRADALVELARSALTNGRAPTVGGVRPQVGVLLRPETLMRNADIDGRTRAARDRLMRLTADADAETDAVTDAETDAATDASAHSAATAGEGAHGNAVRNGNHGQARGDPLAEMGIPPLAEAAWLEWFGEIPDAVAQRLACDADVWRILLEPTTGLPVDVGRSHRIVPHWIRKALWARDRGCRFPGCQAPVAWTDAHHLDPWALGGKTTVDRLLLLCRHHHVLIHEGRWTVHLDGSTGAVTATRPDGRPYEIPPSWPWVGPDRRRAA